MFISPVGCTVFLYLWYRWRQYTCTVVIRLGETHRSYRCSMKHYNIISLNDVLLHLRYHGYIVSESWCANICDIQYNAFITMSRDGQAINEQLFLLRTIPPCLNNSASYNCLCIVSAWVDLFHPNNLFSDITVLQIHAITSYIWPPVSERSKSCNIDARSGTMPMWRRSPIHCHTM